MLSCKSDLYHTNLLSTVHNNKNWPLAWKKQFTLISFILMLIFVLKINLQHVDWLCKEIKIEKKLHVKTVHLHVCHNGAQHAFHAFILHPHGFQPLFNGIDLIGKNLLNGIDAFKFALVKIELFHYASVDTAEKPPKGIHLDVWFDYREAINETPPKRQRQLCFHIQHQFNL